VDVYAHESAYLPSILGINIMQLTTGCERIKPSKIFSSFIIITKTIEDTVRDLYNNFIGIDIGKSEFVSFVKTDEKTNIYKNNSKGFQKFLSDHTAHLAHFLVVLETTGGYENACLNFLLDTASKYIGRIREKLRILYVLLVKMLKLIT